MTFNRLPKATAVERWLSETPDDFLFAVKISRYVTHRGCGTLSSSVTSTIRSSSNATIGRGDESISLAARSRSAASSERRRKPSETATTRSARTACPPPIAVRASARPSPAAQEGRGAHAGDDRCSSGSLERAAPDQHPDGERQVRHVNPDPHVESRVQLDEDVEQDQIRAELREARAGP